MTISQRLVRAGLAFIVFGSVASTLPTDGNAMADQQYNTTAKQYDTLGIRNTDKRTTAPLSVGQTTNLSTFAGTTTTNGTLTTATSYTYSTPTPAGFMITQTNATTYKVKNVSAAPGASVTFTAVFAGGTTLNITVVAQ